MEFLRAWLAALLTGRADLQKFLHLLGAGGTGKGAFIRLATALVGQHNAQVTDLKNLEQNRFEAAALYGKRLAVISDTDKYGGSVNNLKALTGQDHLCLERKNQQQNGTFVFDGLVLLASNEAIQTTDYTGALERRRMTVLFDRIATDAERRLWDAQGGETMVLHREIPGLVNWCLALRREDVTRIITQRPARVIEADTNALRASNPVAEWMMECTIPDPDHKAKIGDKRQVQRDGRTTFDYAEEWLYPNYLTWCQRCGREGLSLVRFSALVIDVARILKAPVRKGKQGDLGRYLKGLRLRGDLENRYDWAATRPTVTGLGRVKDAQPIEKDEGDGWDGFSPQTYLHTREEKFNDTPPPPPTGHPGHPGHPIPPRSENFAAGKKPTSYREVF